MYVILSYFENEQYYRIHSSGKINPDIGKYGNGSYRTIWTHPVSDTLMATRLKNHVIKTFGKRVSPNSLNFYLTSSAEPTVENALEHFKSPEGEKTNIILYHYSEEDFYRVTFTINKASDIEGRTKVWAVTTSDRNEAEAFSRFINSNWGDKYNVDYDKYGKFAYGFKTDNTDISAMKKLFVERELEKPTLAEETEEYEAF